MGHRRSSRPYTCEALEERVVLSQVGSARPLPTIQNTPAQLGPVGVLGDSYSDEYRFYPPDQTFARNWVEMLHTLRGVTFGPFTLASRGEPRNQGFAYDWARAGATSETMIQNQLPGLAAQVANGQIMFASIFIGGNDFLDFLAAAQSGAIPPADIPAALVATTAQLETNYVTAVDTLLAASPTVRVAVWTLPDVSLTPLAQQEAAGNPAAEALLQAVSQATAQFNTLVESLAANPRVALVDLATVANQTAGNPIGLIPFGGQIINVKVPSNDYHSFFLADNLHVGTVAQGIIADEFVLALEQKFNTQLFPPTPQEIIRYAQLIQNRASHPNQGQFP
jgi:phospholipase/lecithinase/hemolysin